MRNAPKRQSKRGVTYTPDSSTMTDATHFWPESDRILVDPIRMYGFVTPNASITRIHNTPLNDFEHVAAEERSRAALLSRLSSDPIERVAWLAVTCMGGEA